MDVCCDRTRENGFKLRGEIQIGYKGIVFKNKGGEALEQVAQRGSGCLIPGDIVRLDGALPVPYRGIGLGDLQGSLPTQIIL